MKKDYKIIAILTLMIALIFLIVLFLLNGRETRTSGERESESVVALRCVSHGREDSFFTSSTVNMLEHEMKVVFKNDKISTLFYTYRGTYRSNEVASDDEAILHAKYNMYMGDNNQKIEYLSPNYSIANNKLIMTFYVDDYRRINLATSRLFFIDQDLIDDFEDYSIDETKNYYTLKNFDCTINE